MYEAYWKIQTRPFDEGAAPEFYFPSRTHQAALLKLRYLIEQRKGIGLIVGEHGLGKSFLTRVLEHQFRAEGLPAFARLSFPRLSPTGVLAYLARRIGIAVSPEETDDSLLAALENHLETLSRQNLHQVFIVDDAHLLEMEHLHLLRLLLNLREEQRADFSLILSGRTELLARLPKLAALDQRIVVRSAVEPLSEAEVLAYVRHRLAASGGQPALFSERTARCIWELSQGIPRRINQICDLALLVGYVDDLHSIGTVEIEAAAEELMSIAA